MASSAAPLLRTSERISFKRCRWQWDRAFNDGLKPKTDAPALRFGDLVHKALERYYQPGTKRGPHPARTFRRLYKKELEQQMAIGYRDEDGRWSDAEELGLAMLKGYVDQFSGLDEEYEVISSEQTFQVPLINAKGRHVATYVGTFDGVWRNRITRAISFKEFKTAKAISIDHLPLDEQAGGYWTFGPDWLREQGLLKEKDELESIIYTFLRKALPDPRARDAEGRCLNQNGEVSKNQPTPLFLRHPVFRDEADRASVRERVFQEVREIRLVRAGKLAAYKNPGGAPPTNNCVFCGFRDICELHETGADWEAMRDATMTGWDPYSAHEMREN